MADLEQWVGTMRDGLQVRVEIDIAVVDESQENIGVSVDFRYGDDRWRDFVQLTRLGDTDGSE